MLIQTTRLKRLDIQLQLVSVTSKRQQVPTMLYVSLGKTCREAIYVQLHVAQAITCQQTIYRHTGNTSVVW